MKRYHRYSAQVIRSKLWQALRIAAKRRDGFHCVQCKARDRLEVDHIKPVRSHPELAFELSNLQCLCPGCHSRKTSVEVGMNPPDPKRQAWRDFTRALAQPERKEKLCLSL